MIGILLLVLISAPSRVIVNEVMANPRGEDGARYPEDRNEFVELYNVSEDTIDLRGWKLSDGQSVDTLRAWTDTMIRVNYWQARIQSTRIYPGGFALVLDPEYTDPRPLGGNAQPYRFGDRVLLLRPGNTTLGDDLGVGDPVILCTPDGRDSSTFGIGTQRHPGDPGDGVSWERMSPDAPDFDTSWLRSCGPESCTPGWVNSAAVYGNLRCISLFWYPLSFVRGVADTLAVTVSNTGRVAATDWTVTFTRNETLATVPGCTLPPGGTGVITAVWAQPEPGTHSVTAHLNWPGDWYAPDNTVTTNLALMPAEQHFCVPCARFGPGLSTSPESLTVVYSLPGSKGELRLRVFDLNGRERAQVYRGPVSGKAGRISWSGADLLPTGMYVLACEYTSGKTRVFEKKTIVLAKR